MTEKVKRYLEISKLFTFDLLKNHEDEYNALCEESKILKQQMTIVELQSLEKHITSREFHMGIIPLIKKYV